MRRAVAFVDLPTLIIGGTLDPTTPPSHSEALAKAITGAELVMLDAAHLSNVEQADAFTEAVTDFLA
ncbi:alpha/beta hydrolase [Sphingobium sp. EM0848]|uniref:alpha/beta hydrolase n=1 Tax=Sphingobium sp. EM0848 TaxID=2743473 RepID=UPI00210145B3|nr:alpha/beta hydrolase [Sphingobium sp. EM0848]